MLWYLNNSFRYLNTVNKWSLSYKINCNFKYNFIQYLFIGENFDKFTIELHFLIISLMLIKYLEN